MVFQDFQADWIERDIDGKLVAATVRVTWATYERDDDGWFSRDFGAGTIVNFDIVEDVDFSDIEAGDADVRLILQLFQLSNTVAVGAADRLRVLAVQDGANDDVWWIQMQQRTGGVFDWLDSTAVVGTLNAAYLRYRRVGAVITFDWYSSAALRAAGAAGSGDVATFNDGGAGNAQAYRYGMVALSANSGVDGTDHSSGFLENLDMAYSPLSIPVMMHHYNRMSKIIGG